MKSSTGTNPKCLNSRCQMPQLVELPSAMKTFSSAAAKPKDQACAARCLPNTALSAREAITSRLSTTGGSAKISSAESVSVSGESPFVVSAGGVVWLDGEPDFSNDAKGWPFGTARLISRVTYSMRTTSRNLLGTCGQRLRLSEIKFARRPMREDEGRTR